MFSEAIHFENLSCTASVLVCFLLALFYVLSLYLWSKKYRFDRDTSNVIIRRFISVILSCFVSVIAIYAIAGRDDVSNSSEHRYLSDWIGFKLDAYTLRSVSVALVLTMILFSGPIIQHFVASYLFSFHHRLYEHEMKSARRTNHQNHWGDRAEHRNVSSSSGITDESFQLNSSEYNNGSSSGQPSAPEFKFSFLDHVQESLLQKPNLAHIKRNYLSNLFFWRNYFISPFTEEFVFRSCMLPLLVPRFSLSSCILITPLFFGLAHLHHIIEGYILNTHSLRRLVMQHMFQFMYTYIFGVYSSYLFLRTGSMFASFASHTFCNLMGFPNINELMHEFKGRTKSRLVLAYVLGLVSFFFLVVPLTDPSMFNNRTYSFKS